MARTISVYGRESDIYDYSRYPTHRAPRLEHPLAWMGAPAATHPWLPTRPKNGCTNVIKKQGFAGKYVLRVRIELLLN